MPKLAQLAKGKAALSVGVMVLLMVTVAYVPLVLPLLISGVEIQPLDIARSLIVLMLLPLVMGLIIKARWPGLARGVQPYMVQASSVAIMVMLIGAIIMQWDSIVSLIGTKGILAIVIVLLGSLALGYFTAGSDPATRSVLGLGTAQRNVSAALVVAAQNFADRPDVLVTVVVVALIGLALLMPIGAELGRRAGTKTHVQ